MNVYDRINDKFDCGLNIATSSSKESEYISREKTSPNYTIRLDDIIKVK